MSNLFIRLQSHMAANKKKDEHCINIFEAIDKYQGKAYFKHFYQINKVIRLDNLFCCASTIVQQYQSFCPIIVICVINNITIYKIFNICIRVSSNSYKYQITNHFKMLLNEDGTKNTSIIIIPILVNTFIHIQSTEFLKNNTPTIIFGINKKIWKRLIIIR